MHIFLSHMCYWLRACAVQFDVNLTQAVAIWEEEIPGDTISLEDQAVGQPVEHLLNNID